MLSTLHGMMDGIGQVSINLGKAMHYIWEKRVNAHHVLHQTAAIGFDSIPIAMIICLISGCVLALHAADKFAMTGANAYVGALVALAMVREMAPIFTAMAVGDC
jgi:phospholipid/cholesterol/gamma-HCH transport system permease protein